jgi:hypothetical protein
MKKYIATIEWSGYSRGISEYEIEAENPEAAMELWYEGKRTYHDVVRDDTEKDVVKIKEVT